MLESFDGRGGEARGGARNALPTVHVSVVATSARPASDAEAPTAGAHARIERGKPEIARSYRDATEGLIAVGAASPFVGSAAPVTDAHRRRGGTLVCGDDRDPSPGLHLLIIARDSS